MKKLYLNSFLIVFICILSEATIASQVDNNTKSSTAQPNQEMVKNIIAFDNASTKFAGMKLWIETEIDKPRCCWLPCYNKAQFKANLQEQLIIIKALELNRNEHRNLITTGEENSTRAMLLKTEQLNLVNNFNLYGLRSKWNAFPTLATLQLTCDFDDNTKITAGPN